MSIWNLAIWWVVTILLLAWAYTIMTRELDEKLDIVIVSSSIALMYLTAHFTGIEMWDFALTSWLAAAGWIFLFFFLQILVSKWAWLWGWDLRIAIMIGLWLWISLWFAWMMLTYILGSFISIFYLIYQRIKNKWKNIETQIPFWPFLALWFFSAIFFQTNIQNFISIYF